MDSWLWKGLHAKLVDGFTFTMGEAGGQTYTFHKRFLVWTRIGALVASVMSISRLGEERERQGNDGIMESWNDGGRLSNSQYSSLPSFQHSNPLLSVRGRIQIRWHVMRERGRMPRVV